MAELVGSAIEVGKCIAGPIKRQFNYLCCFNANIRNLRDEAKKLDDAKVGVEGQVAEARRNIQVIKPQVESWLDDVNSIQANMSGIIEPEIQNVKSGCLAIKWRFSLSRKATKMAADMKELKDAHANFGEISHPPPPAAMASIPLGQTFELQSRKHFEDGIMATLREKKVSMMGICGMGGVGKTTMATKIMSRAREEGLFDEIVKVVVSQPVDMLRVQQDMAELLGLRLEVGSLAARAHQLRVRIMNSKSILIVLDDLWKSLNLEDLGIPDNKDVKECTILLTSRDKDVFTAMNVEKPFLEIKVLEAAEAWSLFKEKVGVCADDQSLFPTAREIVRECKGLPIALVTVGAALKDKTSRSIWENAVEDLRSSNPQDIQDFLAQVYNPLKLSYDLLESEHAKSIFLLCCLFPEDRNILISNLSLYAWGLGMFEGIRSVQVARNKVQTLVEMLKSRFLLMDSLDGGHVKMHDVIRDVGIFIAAKEGLMDPKVSWNSWVREENNCSIFCSWISLFQAGVDQIRLPGGSVFPKLSFLLIEGEHSLSDDFFESSRKLRVLSISYYTTSRSLPIQLLKTLRTLILVECESLEDLSVVGELVSLEILYCSLCRWIKELPVEIGRLNQLKLLHISDCHNLKTIAAGVISRLIRLEELTLMHSFKNWESIAASEGRNASLCELNSLSNLTALRIEIKDASLAAEQIHVPNVVEFSITIGNPLYGWGFELPRSYEREMYLELGKEVIIQDWIHQLLRTTQTLHLHGQGSSKLLPMGNNSLLRLKSLTIESCSMLEQVVLWNEEEDEQTSRVITFPKLEKLILRDLPRLTSFCKGIQSIEFPLLKKMYIKRCPNLKSLVSSTENDDKYCSGAINHDSLHLFCKDQATFSRMEYPIIDGYDSISSLWCDQIPIHFFTGLVQLSVSNCGNIKSLFSQSIAKNLVNLAVLIIERCHEMVKVIIDEEEVERSPFIKLQLLALTSLPKMKAFCDWRCALELPSLRQVVIYECPEMERFSFGSLTIPNLEYIQINGETISDRTKDLNDALLGEMSETSINTMHV